jgi:hypothetical protein
MRWTQKAWVSAFGMALGVTFTASAEAAPPEGASKPALANASTASAAVLSAQILARWQPVAEAAGAYYSAWSNLFGTQLNLMSMSELKRLDALETGVGSSAKADYARFTQAFLNAQANRVMNPESGKTNVKLGSSTTDQVFIPIMPCRVVDTRGSFGGSGPIAAGTQRAFFFYNASASWSWSTTSGAPSGPQGGAPGVAATVCPGTTLTSAGGTLGTVAPSAAMATIQVVAPTAAGNLIAWGGGGAIPQISVINFNTGQTLANTTVIPAGGRTGAPVYDFTVRYNGPSGQADVIVDVVGYFIENHATALQCVDLLATGTGTTAAGDYLPLAAPACATGYTKTGGGCIFLVFPGMQLVETSPVSAGDCYWLNNTGTTITNSNYQSESICCRVPGQ